MAGFGTSTREISQYTNSNYPDAWQRYAIVSPREELCCVAGAGSGKTTVLTARIIFLMARREVAASEIRAVTFMKRVAPLLVANRPLIVYQARVDLESLRHGERLFLAGCPAPWIMETYRERAKDVKSANTYWRPPSVS